MANKIRCDYLQVILANHLEGAVLQSIAERKDYVTDTDGFVTAKTIDRLCDALQQAILIYEIPNPKRKQEVTQCIVKIEKAIEALSPFRTNAQSQ